MQKNFFNLNTKDTKNSYKIFPIILVFFKVMDALSLR